MTGLATVVHKERLTNRRFLVLGNVSTDVIQSLLRENGSRLRGIPVGRAETIRFDDGVLVSSCFPRFQFGFLSN